MEKLTKRGKFLALYQILGGTAGLWIIGASVAQQIDRHPATLLLLALPLLSLAAGIALAMGKIVGYGLSVLTQLLQLPFLKLQGFYFFGFLIGSIVVGKDAKGDFILNWFFGAGADFLTGDIPFQMAGVNLIAVVMLFFLPKVFVKPLE